MGKILKNIQWLIILYAVYNVATMYMEMESKIGELITQQEAQRTTWKKAEKTKKEIANFYQDIDNAKKRIEVVALEIEKTQQLLPSDISDIENIGLLRKMAEDLNIKEVRIAPAQDENRGFYIARKYKFSAKATYLQFLIIFEKIAENKRILNVSDLIFKKLEQSQRSKYQLIDGEFSLEAYKYNSGFKEDRGIDEIEKGFDKNGAMPPGGKIEKGKGRGRGREKKAPKREE